MRPSIGPKLIGSKLIFPYKQRNIRDLLRIQLFVTNDILNLELVWNCFPYDQKRFLLKKIQNQSLVKIQVNFGKSTRSASYKKHITDHC